MLLVPGSPGQPIVYLRLSSNICNSCYCASCVPYGSKKWLHNRFRFGAVSSKLVLPVVAFGYTSVAQQSCKLS